MKQVTIILAVVLLSIGVQDLSAQYSFGATKKDLKKDYPELNYKYHFKLFKHSFFGGVDNRGTLVAKFDDRGYSNIFYWKLTDGYLPAFLNYLDEYGTNNGNIWILEGTVKDIYVLYVESENLFIITEKKETAISLSKDRVFIKSFSSL